MTTAGLDALDRFEHMEADDFGRDIPGIAATLFRSTEAGLLRIGDDQLAVFGNADLTTLAQNPAIGNVPAAVISEDPILFRLLNNHIFTMNPPRHAPHRRLFARPFTAGASVAFAELAEAVVGEVVRESGRRAQVDVLKEIAVPITTRFWARLLAMDQEVERRLARIFADDFSLNFLFARSDEETARLLAASDLYMETISPAITRALDHGDHALLNVMAAEFDTLALEGDPESLGELLGATLADGFHTLAGALANVVYSLLSRPDPHEQVRRQPGLADAAFNEGVRLDPPLIMTFRYALEDVDHDGVRIPEGTLISMLWMYGNRDPRAFDDPDAYDLEHGLGRARSFGTGQHVCPGRSVSRLLGSALLRGLTAPGVGITIDTDAVAWVTGSLLHEPTALPGVVTIA
jgi:cytochrome P450